jgi:hypothetical protein
MSDHDYRKVVEAFKDSMREMQQETREHYENPWRTKFMRTVLATVVSSIILFGLANFVVIKETLQNYGNRLKEVEEVSKDNATHVKKNAQNITFLRSLHDLVNDPELRTRGGYINDTTCTD